MIRIIKGEPLPPAVRAQIDAHPLAVAAKLLQAIGFAIAVGALCAMFFAIVASAVMPISPIAVLTAAGIAFGGVALISQGASLDRRVTQTKLDEAAAAAIPGDWAHAPQAHFPGQSAEKA